jgi:UDP-N-acetyl-D-mannosaminuronic acid dehydrogenase
MSSRKRACVLGLGYIGLPTAVMLAMGGYEVIGVDTNTDILQALHDRRVHSLEDGLRNLLLPALESERLVVQNTPAAADAFIIAVPTPICADHSPDLSAVEAATASIVPYLRRGDLVILESTSPPGTTMNLVKPILEQSGLRAGQDFLLAYSPERVLPGRILEELRNNTRIIGGIDAASSEAAKDLYSALVEGDLVITNATTAEMVKLMENTFRDVNIALANEFALISEHVGIDVWEAIRLANSHPRVQILRPGPGVGGHCIAVDPWFLVDIAPRQSRLIHQARLVNDGMPEHVINRVSTLKPGGGKIAALGLTFKADVDDIRESSALHVAMGLAQQGYTVQAYDPYVLRLPSQTRVCLCPTLEDALRGVEGVLLLVDHQELRGLQPRMLDLATAQWLLDTRGCLQAGDWADSPCKLLTLGDGLRDYSQPAPVLPYKHWPDYTYTNAEQAA